jgi:uncharacterized protein (TIGR02118 family)
MAKLLVLYRHPENAAAFDEYYFGKHVPLAKTVPGLKRFEVSRGPVVTPSGASNYHLVASLEFDSMAALGKGLASPQGVATGADLNNFAQGGVELLVYETGEA